MPLYHFTSRLTDLGIVPLGPRIEAHALKTDSGQDLLRANVLLGTSTWDALLATCPEEGLCTYQVRCFTENLTRRRVERLLRAGDRLERMLSATTLWDVDWAIARALNRHGVGARTVGPLRRCARLLPITSAAVLRGTAPLALKVELARHAFEAPRLLWLATEEADGLGDEEVWDLAVNGKILSVGLERTVFGDEDQKHAGHMRAQLLYARPSLIDRALASSDERWWFAASMVPLTPAHQELLQTLTKANWQTGTPRPWLGKLCDAYAAAMLNPMVRVAQGPWCTKASFDFVIARHFSRRGSWGISLENSAFSWRCYPLRVGSLLDTDRGVGDLDDASLCRWLAGSEPHHFVVAESLRRPLSGTAARLRRAAVVQVLDTLPAVLWRYGRRFDALYASQRPVSGWWWEIPEAQTRPAGSPRALLTNEPIGTNRTDHGAGCLERSALTDQEFEVAFSLWVDPNNDTMSVDDIVACTKAVFATSEPAAL